MLCLLGLCSLPLYLLLVRRPLVFDSYTGADLAWAYNTPLLRLGGAGLGYWLWVRGSCHAWEVCWLRARADHACNTL